METDSILTHRRSMNRGQLQSAADRIRRERGEPLIATTSALAQLLTQAAACNSAVLAAIDAAGDDLAAAAVIRVARSALLRLEGTAAATDASLMDALEDLSLPPHRQKWEPIGFRDEG